MSTWLIIGATSIIAEKFAHLAAHNGHTLVLSGRSQPQLEMIAADIRLRYKVACDILVCDLAKDISALLNKLSTAREELAVFLAASVIERNQGLDLLTVRKLIQVNVASLAEIIHVYFERNQTEHRLIYISSVAACMGRPKNSLYGGSKAAIELYLQGLQRPGRHITIARLGYIDTVQTFGEANIFYASPPENCAKACWKASQKNKRLFYHPFFWSLIMKCIKLLPKRSVYGRK